MLIVISNGLIVAGRHETNNDDESLTDVAVIIYAAVDYDNHVITSQNKIYNNDKQNNECNR